MISVSLNKFGSVEERVLSLFSEVWCTELKDIRYIDRHTLYEKYLTLSRFVRFIFLGKTWLIVY